MSEPGLLGLTSGYGLTSGQTGKASFQCSVTKFHSSRPFTEAGPWCLNYHLCFADVVQMIRRQAQSRCMCTRHGLTGLAVEVKEKRSQQTPSAAWSTALSGDALETTSLNAYNPTSLHVYTPTRLSTSTARDVAQERRWESSQHTKRVEHLWLRVLPGDNWLFRSRRELLSRS